MRHERARLYADLERPGVHGEEKMSFVTWKVPRLIPFLIKFLRAGSESEVRRISKSLALMLHDSPAQHLALATGTGAETRSSTPSATSATTTSSAPGWITVFSFDPPQPTVMAKQKGSNNNTNWH